MNMLKVLLLTLLLVAPGAFAMDEKDIPPPPMPEYMKGHGYDRKIASETEEASVGESFEGQSAEDIKREFLQAGEEEEAADQAVEAAEVAAETEEPAAEERPLAEMAEQPETIVEEDPVREIYQDNAGEAIDKPVEEVSELEEATPEFEQANMPDPGKPMAEPISVEPIKKDASTEEPVAETEEEAEQKESLAVVEEKLEEAEQVAEEIAEGARKPSAKKPFKSGMYTFEEKCVMRAEPSLLSDEAGSIPSGRKLWIDGHNENWLKAYKKSGTVYISADCLK